MFSHFQVKPQFQEILRLSEENVGELNKLKHVWSSSCQIFSPQRTVFVYGAQTNTGEVNKLFVSCGHFHFFFVFWYYSHVFIVSIRVAWSQLAAKCFGNFVLCVLYWGPLVVQAQCMHLCMYKRSSSALNTACTANAQHSQRGKHKQAMTTQHRHNRQFTKWWIWWL